MKKDLPKFEYFEIGKPTPRRPLRKAVVFIHGILSGHETFEPLIEKLRTAGSDRTHRFAYFDYDFHQSIAESGRQFAQALSSRFTAECEVTIVAHSMGGLVSRLALLQDTLRELGFVKRLIMLGTPNHGTLRTGQQGILVQLIRGIGGTIIALTTKKAGIVELSDVRSLLQTHLTPSTEGRTHHVEYVTIPATCFNENVGIAESIQNPSSRFIGLLPLGFEFLKAHPCWRVRLDKPHDGIVEESSVFMGDRGAVTRRSERRATCSGSTTGGPYMHILHDAFNRESHITIQSADQTATIIAELLTCPTIGAWQARNPKSCDLDYKP